MRTDENDKSAWVCFAMERYEGPLTRYVIRLTGDREQARDVVQDTFLRLCAEDPSRLNSHLAEWLFTVCRNRALDVQRKQSRMTPLDEIDLDTRASSGASPDLAAEKSDSTSQVQRLLATLPKNQQEVIYLKFQNGLSYQEISRVTNLSMGNVGFLIHTALKNIRQQLHKEEGLAFNPLRRLS